MPHMFILSCRKWLFLCLSLLVVSLSACTGSSPESVAEDFYKAMAKGRTNEAIELVSFKYAPGMNNDTMKGKLTTFLNQASLEMQEKGGLSWVKAKQQSKTETMATVSVEYQLGKEEKTHKETMNLVKEDGKWKILMK